MKKKLAETNEKAENLITEKEPQELDEIVGEFVDEPDKQEQLSLRIRHYFL